MPRRASRCRARIWGGTASVGSQSDREHTTVSQADTAGTIAHVTSVGPPVGAVKPYIRFYYRGLGDLVTF